MKIETKCTVEYRVFVLEVNKKIPEWHLDNFKEWLQNRAIDNGAGKHCDYFDYDENFENDIEVVYRVDVSRKMG